MQLQAYPNTVASYSGPRFRGIPLPPQQTPKTPPKEADLTAWYQKLQEKYQYKGQDALTPLLLIMAQPGKALANIDALKRLVAPEKDTENVLSYFIENLEKDKLLHKKAEGTYEFTPIAQQLVRRLHPSTLQDETIMKTTRYTTASSIVAAFSVIPTLIGLFNGMITLPSAIGISAAAITLVLGGTITDTLRLMFNKPSKDRKQLP